MRKRLKMDKRRWQAVWGWKADGLPLVALTLGVVACLLGVALGRGFVLAQQDSSFVQRIEAVCVPRVSGSGWSYEGTVDYRREPSGWLWNERITVTAARSRLAATEQLVDPPEPVAFLDIAELRMRRPRHVRLSLGNQAYTTITDEDVKAAMDAGGTIVRWPREAARILLKGCASIPLTIAGILAVVWGGLWIVRRIMQRRRWARYECPWCGYELRGAGNCTECGRY